MWFFACTDNPPPPEINQDWHPEIPFCPQPWATACPTVHRTDPPILYFQYVSEFTGSWMQYTPPLLVLSISNSSVPGNSLLTEREYCSSLDYSKTCGVWSLASLLRISWVLSLLYIIFVIAYFGAADTLENVPMVTTNSNSGQATVYFSANTCKMTLDDLDLSEWGRGVGMSHRNWLSIGFLSWCFNPLICLLKPISV